MRYLLDTNAVIAAVNDRAGRVARRLERCSLADVAVSTVVMHELYFGAYRSRRVDHNVANVDALRFEVVELNRDDARVAGRIRADLAARGAPIGPYDLLIAAQGLARGLIVVTANTREFARVDGLSLEDWS